jgi:hypothetical protein
MPLLRKESGQSHSKNSLCQKKLLRIRYLRLLVMLRGAFWAFHETNIISETFFFVTTIVDFAKKDEDKREFVESFRAKIR